MPFHAVISAQRPLSYILRQEDTGAADGESKAKFHICMCILYVYYTYIHMYYILIPKKLSLVTMIPRNIKPILMFALIIIMDHLLLAELASLPTVGGWSWSGTVGSSVAVAAQWVKFKWRRRARSQPPKEFLPAQSTLLARLLDTEMVKHNTGTQNWNTKLKEIHGWKDSDKV